MASSILPASRDGMSVRLLMWAPTAMKDGVEIAGLLLGQQVVDPMVEHDLDAHVLNALDLGVQHVARQAVGGNTEVHHAAGHRPGFVDFDLVAHRAR
jgi:hypothetical protein